MASTRTAPCADSGNGMARTKRKAVKASGPFSVNSGSSARSASEETRSRAEPGPETEAEVQGPLTPEAPQPAKARTRSATGSLPASNRPWWQSLLYTALKGEGKDNEAEEQGREDCDVEVIVISSDSDGEPTQAEGRSKRQCRRRLNTGTQPGASGSSSLGAVMQPACTGVRRATRAAGTAVASAVKMPAAAALGAIADGHAAAATRNGPDSDSDTADEDRPVTLARQKAGCCCRAAPALAAARMSDTGTAAAAAPSRANWMPVRYAALEALASIPPLAAALAETDSLNYTHEVARDVASLAVALAAPLSDMRPVWAALAEEDLDAGLEEVVDKVKQHVRISRAVAADHSFAQLCARDACKSFCLRPADLQRLTFTRGTNKDGWEMHLYLMSSVRSVARDRHGTAAAMHATQARNAAVAAKAMATRRANAMDKPARLQQMRARLTALGLNATQISRTGKVWRPWSTRGRASEAWPRWRRWHSAHSRRPRLPRDDVEAALVPNRCRTPRHSRQRCCAERKPAQLQDTTAQRPSILASSMMTHQPLC